VTGRCPRARTLRSPHRAFRSPRRPSERSTRPNLLGLPWETGCGSIFTFAGNWELAKPYRLWRRAVRALPGKGPASATRCGLQMRRIVATACGIWSNRPWARLKAIILRGLQWDRAVFGSNHCVNRYRRRTANVRRFASILRRGACEQRSCAVE